MKSKNKTILAFSKYVSREKAIEIIINDYIGNICHARNTNILEYILLYGWDGLNEWSNKQLEEFISELLIENQPNKKSINSGPDFL